MASHLPIESLKTRSGLEPVPGFEPLRNPVPARLESDGLTTAPWRPVSSTLCSCLYPINVQARCPGHTQQGILYMHFPTEQKGQYIPRPLTHQSWGGHWLGWGKKPMGPPRSFDPTTRTPQASALPTELQPALSKSSFWVRAGTGMRTPYLPATVPFVCCCCFCISFFYQNVLFLLRMEYPSTPF